MPSGRLKCLWKGDIALTDEDTAVTSNFTILQDVEIWSEKQYPYINSESRLRYVELVEVASVPLWTRTGAPVLRVFSSDDATRNAIQYLVGNNNSNNSMNNNQYSKVGILLGFDDESTNYLLIYICYTDDAATVEAAPLDVDQGLIAITSQEIDAKSANRFLGPPRDDQIVGAGSKIKSENQIDLKISNLKKSAGRGAATPQRSFSRASSVSSYARPPQPPAAPANDTKTVHRLQRLILGALRMRGVDPESSDHKPLYYHTYNATMFALRDKQGVIGLEQMEEIVDKLLDIFLGCGGSGDPSSSNRGTRHRLGS